MRCVVASVLVVCRPLSFLFYMYLADVLLRIALIDVCSYCKCFRWTLLATMYTWACSMFLCFTSLLLNFLSFFFIIFMTLFYFPLTCGCIPCQCWIYSQCLLCFDEVVSNWFQVRAMPNMSFWVENGSGFEKQWVYIGNIQNIESVSNILIGRYLIYSSR